MNAQLRSEYCGLLSSYNSRIKKDANLNVCAYCGMTPHDVKYLFVCPAHPTTITPSYLWSRPVDMARNDVGRETQIDRTWTKSLTTAADEVSVGILPAFCSGLTPAVYLIYNMVRPITP